MRIGSNDLGHSAHSLNIFSRLPAHPTMNVAMARSPYFRRSLGALAACFAAALTVSPRPAAAVVEAQNFSTIGNDSRADVHLYPYSGGTTQLFDVAGDWAPGTFTNTATNASGDIVLGPAGAGYATTGTWESPTIDSGATGTGAVYGLFNALTSAPSALTNVALGKVASISSVGFSGAASFGNDGDTNGAYGYAAGSVFHTGTNAEQGWWQVDLGSSAPVSSVRLWNRTDCCAARDSDLWVLVSPAPFPATLAAALADPTITKVQVPGIVGTPSVATFPTIPSGQYVRVWQPINEWLHLAEVQVLSVVTSSVSFQVASADSAAGPWNYVGPDGSAATTFGGMNTPLPYGLDGHQFFRVKASLTGNGNVTSSVQRIRSSYALAEATRVAGGTFAVPAPPGSPSWIARIVSSDPFVGAKPSRLLLGAGSVWNTSTSQFGLDAPATTCCSASFIDVTAGAAIQTGAAPSSTYLAGTGAAFSVVATRSDAIGSTAVITASIALATSTVLELPMTITLP